MQTKKQIASVVAQSSQYKEICGIYADDFIKCLSPDNKNDKIQAYSSCRSVIALFIEKLEGKDQHFNQN